MSRFELNSFFPILCCWYKESGILNDDVGRIFVCDGWGDAIHILNKNGQMLALVKTKDFGVEGPLSLCCDGKGDMWIGNRFNSTITVVKITVE